MSKCDKGYKGDCCCNCTNQLTLCKHPWNKVPYHGSITQETGLYVCTVFHDQDDSHKGILFDRKHGCCEMHQDREIK